MGRGYIHITLLFLLLISAACVNPFAPAEIEGDPFGDLLGDPSTIEGFYTRFQNAYEIRDTTLYGPLIHPDFVFTFRDQDRNVDISWGRSEEMSSTHNLFTQSTDVQLRWSNFISVLTNSANTRSQVVRRFDLTVAIRGSDLLRTDGSASFLLIRRDSTENWRLVDWRDESDF